MVRQAFTALYVNQAILRYIRAFCDHLNVLAELLAELFIRHASPLEVYVFVAVANRGEYVMSHEICRRFNGKQQ